MIYKCAVILISAVLLLFTAETNGENCSIRGDIFPKSIWNDWLGYYCYIYTNEYRTNDDRFTIFVNYFLEGQKIKVTPIKNNTSYITYDYKNETSLEYIKKTFKTDHFFEMWISCCEEGKECCDNMGTDYLPTEEYPCSAVWDGWSCFAPAKAGTIEKVTCSKQAYSTDSDVCELLSEKECFANGTWNPKTNYANCAIAPFLRNRHNFNVIILAIAAALALPAVIIFFSFRKFRQSMRYILHRNLILVIIVRNVLTIMSKEIIILDALKIKGSNEVMENNTVACRVLAFFENAAKNGMYACMLADGFYLHKLIVRAFANEPKLVYIYITVLVLSFLPSLIWAIARGVHEAADCWMVDDTGDQWIIDGFRIAILAINFLLLLDIIRVMVMKLRHGSTSRQTKATLRATLFLIPLFGVHIIIITNRNIVPSNTCLAADIYSYLSYTIEGLQGVMVAVLFCYVNSEVRGELKNGYRKFLLYLNSLGIGTKVSKLDDFRRSTAATYVGPHQLDN